MLTTGTARILRVTNMLKTPAKSAQREARYTHFILEDPQGAGYDDAGGDAYPHDHVPVYDLLLGGARRRVQNTTVNRLHPQTVGHVTCYNVGHVTCYNVGHVTCYNVGHVTSMCTHSHGA